MLMKLQTAGWDSSPCASATLPNAAAAAAAADRGPHLEKHCPSEKVTEGK